MTLKTLKFKTPRFLDIAHAHSFHNPKFNTARLDSCATRAEVIGGCGRQRAHQNQNQTLSRCQE